MEGNHRKSGGFLPRGKEWHVYVWNKENVRTFPEERNAGMHFWRKKRMSSEL
jgi:hypothetical protein